MATTWLNQNRTKRERFFLWATVTLRIHICFFVILSVETVRGRFGERADENEPETIEQFLVLSSV